MRQETINIYTIDDHPNKQDCYDYIRDNWHDLGDYVIGEMAASLKALENIVGGKLEYSIGLFPHRREYVLLTDYDRQALEEIYSKREECPLTGVCYDMDVIEGLYMGNLERKVLNCLHDEGEYIYSNDGLYEMIIANEYEFYENGKVV